MKNWEMLGKRCKDIVSESEGIAETAVEWMFGCTQYLLIPKMQDGVKIKDAVNSFFERQLIIVDNGIADQVDVPVYESPKFFGRLCKDKVTGSIGICIGRTVSLFNSDQYVIEYQPEDLSKDARLMWIDEGRIEVLTDSAGCIDSDDIKSLRNGGGT